MKQFLPFIIFLLFSIFSLAQKENPKREMRGVWIATVVNIDFPPKDMVNSKEQKIFWIKMLDSLKNMGINALFVQIRPVSDALYPSNYEPWSAYLTGKQGQKPKPYYDPLKFMLAEAHKRGMEFHAWLNPYRATFDMKLDLVSDQHPFKQHPDWFLPYGTKYYYNPALPQVRDHINLVIKDLASRYEIDGIHFDDYFYPYKIAGETFPDSLDFIKYGQGFDHIDDWRRNNVDLLIESLHKTIRSANPFIKFGISPFGVWRNKAMDPEKGSDTRAGQTTYDDLYADVIKWMKEGWIDYLVPQIYWYIGFELADHQILSEWWNSNNYGTNIYIGHGAYRIGNHSAPEWNQSSEMPNQIRLNRSLASLNGSVYFSAKSLLGNPLGFADSLSLFLHRYPALLPEYNSLEAPLPPGTSIKKIKNKKNGIQIKWKSLSKEKAYYYVIYRFNSGEKPDFEKASNIAGITSYYPRKLEIMDYPEALGQSYQYIIRAVNQKHQEGIPSEAATIQFKE